MLSRLPVLFETVWMPAMGRVHIKHLDRSKYMELRRYTWKTPFSRYALKNLAQWPHWTPHENVASSWKVCLTSRPFYCMNIVVCWLNFTGDFYQGPFNNSRALSARICVRWKLLHIYFSSHCAVFEAIHVWYIIGQIAHVTALSMIDA